MDDGFLAIGGGVQLQEREHPTGNMKRHHLDDGVISISGGVKLRGCADDEIGEMPSLPPMDFNSKSTGSDESSSTLSISTSQENEDH